VSNTLALANITFDCDDVRAVAGFWSRVLGRPLADDPPPGEYFAALGPSPGSPGWLFLKVPEPKSAKNRCHVDLVADDLDAEVARLVGLGANHVADKSEWGHTWAVLQDPEGNEFCVARG
jgi:predicted enzyme related to lactoylglutathione lyase